MIICIIKDYFDSWGEHMHGKYSEYKVCISIDSFNIRKIEHKEKLDGLLDSIVGNACDP